MHEQFTREETDIHAIDGYTRIRCTCCGWMSRPFYNYNDGIATAMNEEEARHFKRDCATHEATIASHGGIDWDAAEFNGGIGADTFLDRGEYNDGVEIDEPTRQYINDHRHSEVYEHAIDRAY